MTALAELEPDEAVVDLASTLSLAARIEPALLRAVRRDLHPRLDPGAEADLWFSALVEARSASGIVLAREALEELRGRLADDQQRLTRACEITEEVHARIAPALVLEEHIVHLALRRPPDVEGIEKALDSVLAAMVDDPSRAASLARWVTRAVPRMPAAVRDLESTWKCLLRASVEVGGASTLVEAELPARARRWLAAVLPQDPRRRWIGVRLYEDRVELTEDADDQTLPLHVPATEPAIVTVVAGEGEPRAIAVPARGSASVSLPDPDAMVELRTGAGELHRLHREWSASERVTAYADLLQSISLSFHVGALGPGGERGSAPVTEAVWGARLSPGQLRVVAEVAEWAMGSVRTGDQAQAAGRWGAMLAGEGLMDRDRAGDVSAAASAFLAAMQTLLHRRLEDDDFDWQGGFSLREDTRDLLEVNAAEAGVSFVASPDGATMSEPVPVWFPAGSFSSIVRLFDLCAERLLAALRYEMVKDDRSAHDDTLRRLLRFWPPLPVIDHTPVHYAGRDRADEPPYVPREIDAAVDEALSNGGLVVTTGRQYSGRTRSAFEGLRRLVPEGRLLLPADGRAAARLSRDPTLWASGDALWLGELEPFLGNHGLTKVVLRDLLERTGARVAVGTISAEAMPPVTSGALERARVVEVPVELTDVELGGAEKAGQVDLDEVRKVGLARYWSDRRKREEREPGTAWGDDPRGSDWPGPSGSSTA